MVAQDQAGTDLDTPTVDWSQVTDMRGAVEALLDAGAVITSDDDLVGIVNDGFKLIEDKADLIDVPMMLLEWATYLGDNGQFMSVRAMIWEPHRDAGTRIVFNDGSTGIFAQLEKIEQRRGIKPSLKERVIGGVKVNGLRVSEYDYTDNQGKTKRAKTYYLA